MVRGFLVVSVVKRYATAVAVKIIVTVRVIMKNISSPTWRNRMATKVYHTHHFVSIGEFWPMICRVCGLTEEHVTALLNDAREDSPNDIRRDEDEPKESAMYISER